MIEQLAGRDGLKGPSRPPVFFRHLLYERSRELEISVREIGIALEVTVGTVYWWLEGRTLPKKNRLLAISALLQIPIADTVNAWNQQREHTGNHQNGGQTSLVCATEHGTPAGFAKHVYARKLLLEGNMDCHGWSPSVCEPCRQANNQSRRDRSGKLPREFWSFEDRVNYWKIIGETELVRQGKKSRELIIICLLCGNKKTRMRGNIAKSKCCRGCSTRLRSSGVSKRNGRWLARIGIVYNNGGCIRYDLGAFSSFNEAARAYDQIAYEHYGHTHFCHFPDEHDQSNDPVFVPVERSEARPK